jgi:hypothetical protein
MIKTLMIEIKEFITRGVTISGCSTTTLMMIACTPVLLPPEVSYVDGYFPKHYA